MKINSKGAISVTLRNDDKDLRDFIDNLPERAGSDILRAIIRDGIKYQTHLPTNYQSNLSLLCKFKRYDLQELIQPFFGEEQQAVEEVEPVINVSEELDSINATPTTVKKDVKSDKKKSVEDAFEQNLGEFSIYRTD